MGPDRFLELVPARTDFRFESGKADYLHTAALYQCGGGRNLQSGNEIVLHRAVYAASARQFVSTHDRGIAPDRPKAAARRSHRSLLGRPAMEMPKTTSLSK